MAIEVIEDVMEGLSYSDEPNGAELVRVFKVSGLVGMGAKHLVEAVNHKRIPKIGQWSDIDGTLQVSKRMVTTEGDNVKIVVTHNRLSGARLNIDDNGPCQIEYGSSIAEFQTQLDLYGNQITTKHTFPDKLDENGNPKTITQPGTVTVQVPVHTRRYTRRERTDPEEKCWRFTGSVNAQYWGRGAPHTWLCKVGANKDDGQSWLVTYDLTYLPETWDPTVVAVDEDGNPVLNPVQNQGIKSIRTQPEIAFSGLNLGVK